MAASGQTRFHPAMETARAIAAGTDQHHSHLGDYRRHLVLVAMARIHQFAENAATTMTEAVLSKIDLPPKEVLANLQNLTR
jgi:hypothetical protein